MSNKGAVKKTTESKNHSKSNTSQIVRKSLSHDSNEPDERLQRREKRKEQSVIDIKASSDRKTKIQEKRTKVLPGDTKSLGSRNEKIEKKKEPRIINMHNIGNQRHSKTEITVTNRNVLPDKVSFKLKQMKQNSLSTSKSSLDDSSTNSVTLKKPVLSKTKFEHDRKVNVDHKTKTNAQNNNQEKRKILYNEKRGISSIYAPKDAAKKLSSEFNSLNKYDNKNRKQLPLSTKNSEKTVSRHSSKERKRSRTLSPSEVKVLNSKSGTVNYEASIKVQDEIQNEKESDIEEKYNSEEDFEDYESNFEEDSNASQIPEETDNSEMSLELEPIVLHTVEKKKIVKSLDVRKVEEEYMFDSGHYELAEAKKRAAMVEALMANRIKASLPISELKQPINELYREEKQTENKSLPSSTDEGFEDSRSGDFVKSPPGSQITLVAQEMPKIEKTIIKKPKILTRGQILMSMIKLDTVEWSLYESTPISYDEFIRSYGKLNTRQVFSQTNEDNLDVEIQTDKNDVENKWSQFPVKCRNKLKTNEDIRLFKIENIGVGGDSIDNSLISSASYDILKLNEFLSRAGKLMLALLEEKEFGGTVLQNETHEFPFSEGFIKLSVNSLSFLCGRPVVILHYSETNNKVLMSIHAASKEITESLSSQEYIISCCIGCVWNINEPSRPTKLFYSQSPIMSCCFHCTNNNIVFAGLEDGSLCLWDLREEETWHQKIIDKVNETDWIIRCPTYTTAGNWEIKAHKSSVVAIRILSKVGHDETESFEDKFMSIQICSLDEDGFLIIWSVVRNLNLNSDDLGLSQWGKVKLVKSQEVPLREKNLEINILKKQFVDMNVDSVDSNNLYLATNDTNVLCVNCIGGKNNTLYYKMDEMDSCTNTTCIEVCPFKQSYFLAGCNDGSIRLHSLIIETPLLKLKDEHSSAGIKSIQWSKSKPLTIYVLDNNSRIIVWDLSSSDISPSHITSTRSWDYVKCMRLSPCNTNRDRLNQYLALGTDTGNVEVHKLKKNFYLTNQDDLLQEMNSFTQYVSVL